MHELAWKRSQNHCLGKESPPFFGVRFATWEDPAASSKIAIRLSGKSLATSSGVLRGVPCRERLNMA
jgi:hypothetical protein